MPRSINSNVYSASHSWRQELIDCSENGSEFSSPTDASEQPAQQEEREDVPRQAKHHPNPINEQRNLGNKKQTKKIDLRP